MATAGHSSPELFAAVALEARGRLGDFQGQGLANMAWAFAKAGCADEELFRALAREVPPRLGGMSTQELANFAWAFATAGHAAPELFEALAATCVPRLEQFKEQEIANLAWAYATTGVDHPLLFSTIAFEAERRIQHFAPQGLANLAWALAILLHQSPISAAVSSKAGDVTTTSSTGGDSEPRGDVAVGGRSGDSCSPPVSRYRGYFTALAHEISEGGRASELTAQGLANVAWAFATSGESHPAAFNALGKATLGRLPDLSPQGLANVAWAFATAGHANELFGPLSIELQV